MTKFTKFIVHKTLKQIALEPSFLDFTSHSKLEPEIKQDNYAKCLDYCFDMLTEIIEATLTEN